MSVYWLVGWLAGCFAGLCVCLAGWCESHRNHQPIPPPFGTRCPPGPCQAPGTAPCRALSGSGARKFGNVCYVALAWSASVQPPHRRTLEVGAFPLHVSMLHAKLACKTQGSLTTLANPCGRAFQLGFDDVTVCKLTGMSPCLRLANLLPTYVVCAA